MYSKKIKSGHPVVQGLESRAYFSSVPATITVTVPGPIPSAVIAGVKVNDKIAVNVADNDVNNAKGRVSVTLFASLDDTLSSDDAQIQPATVAGIGIKPGHNHTYKINVKSFPQNLSGEYFVIAEVAGTGVNTEVGTSIQQVDIQQPNIDLAGLVTKATPLNAHIGHTLSVTVEITNDGNVLAKGSLPVDFALSASNTGTSTADLGTLDKPINIKPGHDKVLKFSVPLVLGLPTGNQYIVANVDPTNTFLDVNLANNVNTFQTAISIT